MAHHHRHRLRRIEPPLAVQLDPKAKLLYHHWKNKIPLKMYSPMENGSWGVGIAIVEKMTFSGIFYSAQMRWITRPTAEPLEPAQPPEKNDAN